MTTNQHQFNLYLIKKVATKLDHLLNQVVFIGGSIIGLLLTDPGTPDVRETEDVDLIVEITSLSNYYSFLDHLRTIGFKESSKHNVICRWKIDTIIVDIMPTDEGILGFSNIWYKEAAQNCNKFKINENQTINLISAPYFIATKLEAFKHRGNNDLFLSHDLEDVITIIDGRPELSDEIESCNAPLKEYLKSQFEILIQHKDFSECVAGHLGAYPGNLQYRRRDIVLTLIKNICS